jgi:PAS domain S-box-containing protein
MCGRNSRGWGSLHSRATATATSLEPTHPLAHCKHQPPEPDSDSVTIHSDENMSDAGADPKDDLLQALALMQAALESTADGIVVTDGSGSITAFNERYMRMFAIPPEILDTKDHRRVLDVIQEQFPDPRRFRARVEEIYASSLRDSHDVLTLVDGRVYERVSKVQTIGGRTVGRVWSFRDTTERVRAESASREARRALQDLNETLEQKVVERTDALRSSERQFEQLVAGVTDCAIYMLDVNGRVASWNLGAERIKGYSSEEIIGRHFSEFYTPEDRANSVPNQTLSIARSKGKFEGEGWRMRKDGTRFWASVLVDSIYDSTGSLRGFAKITRDMTERRAMQEQLNQSQKMEAIGQLTGGVAHDFNNLLTVILGNLDTISRHLSGHEVRLHRALEQASRGAQRAAKLTQQLLAFSRRQPLDPKPNDVNRLVAGMSDLIRRAVRENVSLQTVLAGSLWTVEVDANELESALLNLAVNSRDAMPEGGVLTIETSNVTLDEAHAARFADILPGEYVLISVTDTGAGMSADVLARAFDPFFTTKPIGQGTGLGLSQVFGFVKQSGGTVRLHSEVGVGTTVKVYLPRFSKDVRLDAKVEERPAVALDPAGQVLVVEDERDVRLYSTECLRELGFSVLEAHDGPSALEVLENHADIELLFTDVGLPGMNGQELVQQALERRPELKVLFTTGYARNAIVHGGRLDAGIELLTKPFTQAQLASSIRHVMSPRPK